MSLNIPRSDLFFPIEEAPVFASVTCNGKARDAPATYQKALVAADKVGKGPNVNHAVICQSKREGVFLIDLGSRACLYQRSLVIAPLEKSRHTVGQTDE